MPNLIQEAGILLDGGKEALVTKLSRDIINMSEGMVQMGVFGEGVMDIGGH